MVGVATVCVDFWVVVVGDTTEAVEVEAGLVEVDTTTDVETDVEAADELDLLAEEEAGLELDAEEDAGALQFPPATFRVIWEHIVAADPGLDAYRL